jgi:flagellar hook assembly protein FlgD
VPNRTEGKITPFADLNQEAEVEIQIFTATGRNIRRLRPGRITPSDGANKGIFWDGRDEDGDELANGVYFFKISVRGENGERKERVERLVVLR